MTVQQSELSAPPEGVATHLNDSMGSFIVIELMDIKVDPIAILDAEQKVYVKMNVCSSEDEISESDPTAIVHSSVQSGRESFSFHETFSLRCDFKEGSFLVMEVKQRRLLQQNRRIGILGIPMSFFYDHFGRQGSKVVDDAFKMYLGKNVVTGRVNVRLRVRGKVLGTTDERVVDGFKVTNVTMASRKLSLWIKSARLDASVIETGRARALDGKLPLGMEPGQDLPCTYVKIQVENKEHIFGETRIAKNTLTPSWEEEFEFFSEICDAKCLTIKVKEHYGVGLKRVIGYVRVPIFFFLSQDHPDPIDQRFPILDSSTTPPTLCGNLHVLLSVKTRAVREAHRVNRGRSTSVAHGLEPNHTTTGKQKATAGTTQIANTSAVKPQKEEEGEDQDDAWNQLRDEDILPSQCSLENDFLPPSPRVYESRKVELIQEHSL